MQRLAPAVVVIALWAAACTTADNPQLAEMRLPSIPEGGQFSLLTARLAAQHVIGVPTCPDDSICLDAVFEDTFDAFETQLGPVIGGPPAVRSVRHSEFPGDLRLAYIVQTADDGKLWALDVAIVRDDRACFGEWLAADWPHFAQHRRTSRSGDELCFRVY